MYQKKFLPTYIFTKKIRLDGKENESRDEMLLLEKKRKLKFGT